MIKPIANSLPLLLLHIPIGREGGDNMIVRELCDSAVPGSGIWYMMYILYMSFTCNPLRMLRTMATPPWPVNCV